MAGQWRDSGGTVAGQWRDSGRALFGRFWQFLNFWLTILLKPIVVSKTTPIDHIDSETQNTLPFTCFPAIRVWYGCVFESSAGPVDVTVYNPVHPI